MNGLSIRQRGYITQFNLQLTMNILDYYTYGAFKIYYNICIRMNLFAIKIVLLKEYFIKTRVKKIFVSKFKMKWSDMSSSN